MALRSLARRLDLLVPSGVRLASSTPTVFDKMVQFFVIDKSGVRHAVRGLEGQTLAQAMQEYGQLGPKVFLPNAFQPASPDAHVYVSYDFINKLPSLPEEESAQQERIVEDYVRRRARDNSRMAHYIPLSKALNGMTVAVGETEPWETK